jgi:RecJ-like exonuclease
MPISRKNPPRKTKGCPACHGIGATATRTVARSMMRFLPAKMRAQAETWTECSECHGKGRVPNLKHKAFAHLRGRKLKGVSL